jgi:hypothetical protein
MRGTLRIARLSRSASPAESMALNDRNRPWRYIKSMETSSQGSTPTVEALLPRRESPCTQRKKAHATSAPATPLTELCQASTNHRAPSRRSQVHGSQSQTIKTVVDSCGSTGSWIRLGDDVVSPRLPGRTTRSRHIPRTHLLAARGCRGPSLSPPPGLQVSAPPTGRPMRSGRGSRATRSASSSKPTRDVV